MNIEFFKLFTTDAHSSVIQYIAWKTQIYKDESGVQQHYHYQKSCDQHGTLTPSDGTWEIIGTEKLVMLETPYHGYCAMTDWLFFEDFILAIKDVHIPEKLIHELLSVL